jgi:catechol 2,3-dioxygenase-like lactoylglutathione lyase family enzyme
MRIDHLAFRVPNRDAAVDFLMKALGYKFQAEFEICFNDEKTDKALCIALEPPEKVAKNLPWTMPFGHLDFMDTAAEYHMAPEIFVSEGTPGSIVDQWVKSRGGVGGIHHIALQCNNVEDTMRLWQENGWGDFTSAKPFTCDGLTQVFSAPNCTGVIWEFIEREGYGFCQQSVKNLMSSTANLDKNIP